MPQETVEIGLVVESKKFEAAIEAANKKWQEHLDKLRASHKTYVEVEKEIDKVAGQLKIWSTATDKADKATTAIINTQRQELAGLRALRDEYWQAAQAQAEAERQLEAELQRTWNTTQRQIAEEAKLARQRESESAQAARLQAKEEADLAKAKEKQAETTSKLLKQGFLWAAGAASLYYAYRTIRTAVLNSAEAIYKETEGYKALKEAQSTLLTSLAASISPYREVAALMGDIAKVINDVARVSRELSAVWFGLAEAGRAFVGASQQVASQADPLIGLLGLLASYASMTITGSKSTELLTVYQRRYNDVLGQSEEALRNAASASRDYSGEVQSLIRKLRDYNAAASEQVAATSNIISQFNAAAMDIRDDYIKTVTDIEADLAKQIGKINAKALEQREKALASYYKNIERAQRAAQKQESNNAAQHALEMQYAQRRYNLTLLQNERLYLYNRGQLVAEGDVLAIDDLDARYELEKQAQKENFELQMQQAEAMYRLQARIQKEAIRESIAELQLGLREQLAEIEKGRRDQVEEAELAAAEKQAAAEQAASEALIKEKLAMQQQLEEQEKAHDERLQDLAEYLAEFGQKMGFSYDDTLSLAQNYFGVNGTFDTLFKEEWERQASYTEIFTTAIQRMVQASAAQLDVLGVKIKSITAGGGRGGYWGGVKRTNPTGSRPYPYAYGGEFVTSTPTPIMVGESGPERVVVQPLSPIGVGGNVSMSWKGGPIPVQGTGSLEGIDVSAIGNAIGREFAINLNRSFSGYRGQRGR